MDDVATMMQPATGWDILALYARHQRERDLSPETLRHYRTIVGQLIAWLEPRGISLSTCTEADVRAWVFTDGRTSTTHRIYLSRLGVFFCWMVDEGLREDLPTQRIRRPASRCGVPRPVETEGLRRAIATADVQLRLMLVLASYAGLRRAEIARLCADDILASREPPVLRVFGKGRRTRLVPIGPAVAAAIEAYGPLEAGPLFRLRDGRPMQPQTVGDRIANHLRASGVDATAHQCRHWFASELYQRSDGDLLVVQQMLGHASVATTQTYVAWSPTKAAAAIALL